MTAERANPLTEIIVKKLPCKLTPEESREFGQQLATQMQAFSELEETKKATMADYTAQLKALRGELNRLSAIVNQGYETREVDCEKSVDGYLGRVNITRTDTDEVVEERPLRDGDLRLFPYREA